LLQNNVGATFYDARISNYTQFVFLPKQLAIFVVGNTATILKLDMTSFFLMDSFTLPQPTKPNIACRDPRNCKEATEISLLAMMPNEHMVWFCYVHHFQYLNRPPQHVESRCMVPQVGNLAEALVQWENPHFNSLDPRQSASILNAADGYTYISAFAPDYVRIFRAHMPDWNGRVNWTGALVTDKSRVFISEPATVLLTFETENEVYFVLREESAASKSRCIQACDNKGNPGMFEGSVSDVARLVRICKGDRGGLPHVSAENFGTFAKSDLQCQAADRDGNYYTYTHISKAYWDNSTQRLYAVFTTEKWAPMGSALCVYTKLNIQSSFDGPLLESSAVDMSLPPTPVPNSFVNICQRFNSMNLTMEELDFGRRLSLRYPNRYEPVYPLYKRALFVQTGILWIHLQVYDLPPLPTYFHFGNPARTTIIWLGSKRSLDKIVVYQPTNSIDTDDSLPVVCKLNEVHIGRSLNILKQPLDVNEQQKQHQERNRRHKGRQVPKRSAKELYLKFWRLNSQSSEIPTTKEPAEEIREVKVLSSSAVHIQWPCRDLNPGHLTCEASVLPLLHKRTLDACEFSRLNRRKCSHLSDVIGVPIPQNPKCNQNVAHWVSGVPDWRVNRSSQPGHLLGRRSMYRAHQSHRSSVNTFACSDVKIQMRPTCVGGVVVTRSPRMSDVRGSNPGTATGYALLMSSNKSETGVQCFTLVWTHRDNYARTGGQQFKREWCSERNWLDWSVWSPCDLKTGVQTRERRCRQNAICVGSSREQRFCSEISVWSNPFQDNKMSDKLSFSPQARIKPATIMANLNGDSFSVAYVILIALCCLLIGVFITSFVFCLFPRFSHICRPDGYNRCTIEQSCKNPLPVSRLNSDWSNKTPNPANKCWNEVETDKVDWIEKPLNHCGRSLDPEARYQALLEKPPGGNTLERSDRKRTGFSRKFTASQQPLLSGSPVPSPISIPSGLSTASMCIRDKFTFEHLTDPPEDPKASLTQPPSMVLDLKHTNSPVLCMNKYLTASGNCDSAENSSVERSLNTPQCGRNSEHRKGVEPNCFHENN
ncbi:Semaphorin-3C, partial [Clonorchis sinensis]